MTVLIFGGRWDAPICDDAVVYPEIPTYAECHRCREPIAEDDQGFVRPLIGSVEPECIVGVGTGHILVAIHRECDLAGIVGHMVGVCTCTGWNSETRAAAREVLRRVEAGELRMQT